MYIVQPENVTLFRKEMVFTNNSTMKWLEECKVEKQQLRRNIGKGDGAHTLLSASLASIYVVQPREWRNYFCLRE